MGGGSDGVLHASLVRDKYEEKRSVKSSKRIQRDSEGSNDARSL